MTALDPRAPVHLGSVAGLQPVTSVRPSTPERDSEPPVCAKGRPPVAPPFPPEGASASGTPFLSRGSPHPSGPLFSGGCRCREDPPPPRSHSNAASGLRRLPSVLRETSFPPAATSARGTPFSPGTLSALGAPLLGPALRFSPEGFTCPGDPTGLWAPAPQTY